MTNVRTEKSAKTTADSIKNTLNLILWRISTESPQNLLAKFVIKSKDSLRALYRFSTESATPCLKNAQYHVQALIYKEKKANLKFALGVC